MISIHDQEYHFIIMLAVTEPCQTLLFTSSLGAGHCAMMSLFFITVSEPCRTPLFTCSMGAGHCTMMEFVLDGREDCQDGSDEGNLTKKNYIQIINM